MKKLFLKIFAAVTAGAFAFGMDALANGDPVIAYSAYVRSCNPVPLKVSSVQVIKEDLYIKPGFPYADIEVTYYLRNNLSRSIHVDYGFPIDFHGEIDGKIELGGDEFSESCALIGGGRWMIKDVSFNLSGKELDWTTADRVISPPKKVWDEYMEMDLHEDQISRLWTYTALDLPASETVKFTVRYSVVMQMYVPFYGKHASPINRFLPEEGRLVYDFTPAQHWGNGKVGELDVTVDLNGLPDLFFSDEHSSPNFEGMEFEASGKIFKSHHEDFDFAAADPLEIYAWAYYEAPDTKQYMWGDPLKDYAILPSLYKVTTSGSQEKYPASNLSDGDLKTAWVAKGDGVGSTIDIDFPVPMEVSDIALYNGYHKTPDLWYYNSRILSFKVEVTRADGYVDVYHNNYDDPTDDSNIYTLMSTDGSYRFGEPTMLSITNLGRKYSGRLRFVEDLMYFESIEVPDGDDFVKHIKITVNSVIPGTKYSDLCVSDIIILNAFSQY